jgi:transcriptional regulator with XRE-family HTH domain
MHNVTIHWTERSVNDFLYRIASDFVTQLKQRIQSETVSKAKLAEKLGVSKGRVSQILNNPGNLTLKMIIKCARALGMKVAIVAYDDGDQTNERGPINSEIFRVCWENSGKPIDFWSIAKPQYAVANTALLLSNVEGEHRAYISVNSNWQGGGTNPLIRLKESFGEPVGLMTGVSNLYFGSNAILEKEGGKLQWLKQRNIFTV